MADRRRKAARTTPPARTEYDGRAALSCPSLDNLDERALAELYAEFAEEDRALADAGLADYARSLASLDKEE
jgi:hypothetical protein